MRVLIVNTSERTGGAAVAAHRLLDALNANGVKAKMLVRNKETDKLTVVGLRGGLLQQWKFLWERWTIFCRLHFHRQQLFELDTASAGNDITRLPEFREADIIHLHWVNQGMLSLRGIQKILRSGKPVVWTMHDLWPATAVCHYARGCYRFKNQCKNCPRLPRHSLFNDLAAKVWKTKTQMLNHQTIHFVACSHWLEGEAKKSGLLKGQPVTSIPNPISTQIFHPTDRAVARQQLGLPQKGRILLFVSQRVTVERKGIHYFIDAINQLASQHPDMAASTSIAILGGHAEEIADQLPLPTHLLGYVNDEQRIVAAYNAADVFVTPSLEDNLPNTIMEAMACGIPCVGYRVGGIPEMIDHLTNGYVAKFRSVDDLANGIHWVLDEADSDSLRSAALHKVSHNYSQTRVAMKYTEVYNEALALKSFIR